MNLKKFLVIGMAVFALGFAAVPRSEAGVSVGIGIGVPIGYGYGYPPAIYPYGCGYAPYGYGYAPYGYGYGYRRAVVNVYVRPHYHWRNHHRIYCRRAHR